MAPRSETPEPQGLFPRTGWTLVLAARRDPAVMRQALDALLRPRWKALFVLARKRGLSPERAEDAVQSFAEQLIEGDLMGRLDPGRGRLRAYLRTAFANHLANLAAHEGAVKRGGGRAAVPLDDVEALVASPAATPEALFDRAWALALFEDALAALEAEFARGERQGPFAVLHDLFRFGETEPYEALARRYEMTVPQLKAFVHRAKQRFRQLLRARVTETVLAPGEADAELHELMRVLAS